MIPEPLLLFVCAVSLILFGIFLAWLFWAFHIRPTYFRRKNGTSRPLTLRIKAEPPRL